MTTTAAGDLEPGLAELDIAVSGGLLHAIELGEGPVVVLLHGVTANAFVWVPVMEALAGRYRTVAIDQRGHGQSRFGPSSRYDAEAYANDVAEVAAALGGSKVLVVGHSLGARNAIEAASRRPDLVAGAVAIDFAAHVEAPVFQALSARVGTGSKVFSDHGEVTRYLSERYPGLDQAAVARRARSGYVEVSGGFEPLADPEAMLATCAGLREDLKPALSAIAVPTVLVRGEKSAFVSVEAFAATCKLRPDLRAVVVEGADHYVAEERPVEVARIISELGDEVFEPTAPRQERSPK